MTSRPVDCTVLLDRQSGVRRLLALASAAACALSIGGILSANVAAAAAPSSQAAQLARHEVLPHSAFPKGWVPQGKDSTATGMSFFNGIPKSAMAGFAQCLGMSTAHIDPNPREAASPEYDDPNSDMTVTDTVDVFPSVADAKVDAEGASSATAPSCMTPVATSWFSSFGKTGQLTATAGPMLTCGAHSADILYSFPFSQDGVSGTQFVEDLWVQQGRSETILEFWNTGSPVPASIVDKLTRAAASRLSARCTTVKAGSSPAVKA